MDTYSLLVIYAFLLSFGMLFRHFQLREISKIRRKLKKLYFYHNQQTKSKSDKRRAQKAIKTAQTTINNFKIIHKNNQKFIGKVGYWVVLTCVIASAGFSVNLNDMYRDISLIGGVFLINLFINLGLITFFYFASLRNTPLTVMAVLFICSFRMNSGFGGVLIEANGGDLTAFSGLVFVEQLIGTLAVIWFLEKAICCKTGKNPIKSLLFNPATIGFVCLILIATLELGVQFPALEVAVSKVACSYGFLTSFVLGMLTRDAIRIKNLKKNAKYLHLMIFVAFLKLYVAPLVGFHGAELIGLQSVQMEVFDFFRTICSTSAAIIILAVGGDDKLYGTCFLIQLVGFFIVDAHIFC